MTCAVCLRLDDVTATRVVRMWERLYVHGADTALLLPSTEAQVTLAAYPDDVPTDRIDAALDHLSGSCAAIQVGITGLGIFAGVSPVLWLAVAPTAALVGLHTDLHTNLGDLPCQPRYLPGRWTPGIAVSQHATSVTEAVRLMLPMLMEPITGTLVTVELIQYPSGTAISSRSLPRG